MVQNTFFNAGIKSSRNVIPVVLMVLLAGCGVESKLTSLSDADMRKKQAECTNMNDPAPAMIFACENYQRECDRRKAEKGHFVC